MVQTLRLEKTTRQVSMGRRAAIKNRMILPTFPNYSRLL